MTQLIPTAHLEPETWARVNRRLCCKAIAEFAHELLISPERERADGPFAHYVLRTDDPNIEYRFRAELLQLDHWFIDQASLRKLEAGRAAELDALRLICELRTQLGIPADILPEYLQDLASTLFAAAYKQARGGLSADALARADFQTVEGSMSEGHPCFVANDGCIGFNATDFHRYAPEANVPVSLVWLAAHERRAEFSCVHDTSYSELVARELGSNTVERFETQLRVRGCDPARYRFLPAHPWQWENRLAQLFAADIAAGDLVYLGRGAARYLPQQSIRTLFNSTEPSCHYVKTSLSIVNLGFTRGIPASITDSAAAVNDWARDLVANDPYLSGLRFSVLREVAFIAYRHRYYEATISKRSDPYKEMLAALWRETPTRHLQAGQRVITMAALMHVDDAGAAVLPALMRASGVSVERWLAAYLRHYLTPLLHCFYAHDLLFTPHCENTLLVLQNELPVAVMLKDLAEDIGVQNPRTPLPAAVRRIALRVPEELVTLGIFTDVFDCVFRFLAQILYEHARYPEQKFWRAVADCVREYQREQPQLRAKFRRYDLFAPSFARNCLNRLQLRNNKLMVDLNAPEPVTSLQLVGELTNPIAAFNASEAP